MSIPTQHKALFLLDKLGNLAIQPTDVYTPGAGELLVRVEATALNPVDWKIQQYGLYVEKYPVILGSDAAGVVAKVGEGVTSFAVGDKVLFQGYFVENKLGTFQQYTIIPAEITAKLPSNLTFDSAASVPLGLATAFIALYGSSSWEGGGAQLPAPWRPEGGGKFARKPIVIFGGSSSVGSYVIQAAKLSGFSPIITTVSPHNDDLVKSLGATHTIDRRLSPSEIVAKVKEITSKPVEYVYDAVSITDTQKAAVEILATGGTLLLLLAKAVDIPKNIKAIRVYGTVHAPQNREFGVELYNNITRLLESGDIKPNVVEVIPKGLAGIPEGLDKLRNDKVSGAKLVVRPPETP
ncbi:medium-chain dehydrogenase/reductase like protein [Panus rudis PR-1116 ss-1]|nr:medium-chain dehydrogenase/reductase like protein [Panus rudis PR-1116 ss-1]